MSMFPPETFCVEKWPMAVPLGQKLEDILSRGELVDDLTVLELAAG